MVHFSLGHSSFTRTGYEASRGHQMVNGRSRRSSCIRTSNPYTESLPGRTTERSRSWLLRQDNPYTRRPFTMTGSARSCTRQSSSFQVLMIGKLCLRSSLPTYANRRNRTVRIYNASSGTASGEAWSTGRTGNSKAIAVSPNGKILAAGSDDYSIILYNMDTRKMIRKPIRGHNGVGTPDVLHSAQILR